MWLAFVLVAVTCAGTVFMIRFLIALLQESPPSVCYWVIPSVAGDGGELEQEDREADFECDIRKLASSDASMNFMEAELAGLNNDKRRDLNAEPI
jgi:hypothetical protein